MKMNEILDTIEMLSHSQGFYGRLLRRIMQIKEVDIESYNAIVDELESQHFNDAVDMVLYFEC